MKHPFFICAMVKSRYIGDGHPTFNRNPYNGYINPYYWVDDHPLLYGNNGSLDAGTYRDLMIPGSTLHWWPDTEPAVMAAAAGVPSWPVTFRPRSEAKLTKPRVTSPKP